MKTYEEMTKSVFRRGELIKSERTQKMYLTIISMLMLMILSQVFTIGKN